MICTTDDDVFLVDDPYPFFAWLASIMKQLPKIAWTALLEGITVEQAGSERMRDIVISWSPQPQ